MTCLSEGVDCQFLPFFKKIISDYQIVIVCKKNAKNFCKKKILQKLLGQIYHSRGFLIIRQLENFPTKGFFPH
jgi:hypothetical protein